MIDAERAAPRRPPADGADALLLREQPPVLLLAQPVETPDARERVTLAIGGIRSPSVAPQLVEPLAMLGAIDAVGGELVLAMLRILGISFPVLFVREGHCTSPDCAGRDRSATDARTQKAPGLALRQSRARGSLRMSVRWECWNCAPPPARGSTKGPRGTTDAPMRRRCTHRGGAEAVQTHFWLVPE
jgi:hypothetical protein